MGLLGRRLRKAGAFNRLSRKPKVARPKHVHPATTIKYDRAQEPYIGKSIAKQAAKSSKALKTSGKPKRDGKPLSQKGLPESSNRDFSRKIKISPTGNSDRSIQQAAVMGGDNVADSIVGEFQAMHGGSVPTPHQVKSGSIGRVVKPPKAKTGTTVRKPKKSAKSAGESMLERFKKAKEGAE